MVLNLVKTKEIVLHRPNPFLSRAAACVCLGWPSGAKPRSAGRTAPTAVG